MTTAGSPPTGWRDASRQDEEGAHLLPAEVFDLEESEPRREPRRNWIFLTRWISGPADPRPHRIEPILPTIQRWPTVFLQRILPNETYRAIAAVVLILVWIVLFGSLALWSGASIKDASGDFVVNLDCVDTFWPRQKCGLDGEACRPFANTSFVFRCPANCAGVKVLNPRPVGALDINYRALVIGSNPYRGDSFICGSAIHASVITNSAGGCGRVSRVGEHDEFPGSEKNGISSIDFPSVFPMAISIQPEEGVQCVEERRGTILCFSIFFTGLVSIFASSASFQFFVIFTAIFAHVSFISDPPTASLHNVTVLPDHLSSFAKGFLPAAFCAVVLYRTCIRRTLDGLEAPAERTLLWVGAFWFGALSNYTFDWLPIQRLTPHDLQQQPGAIVALIVIVCLIAVIVTFQVYCFWGEGRLRTPLLFYLIIAVAILLLVWIPGVELRIHHYVIALLFLPGTSMQTRASLLFQGLLLGLFVNGIARWGFASILETPAALRDDAPFGSPTPSITEPFVHLLGQAAWNVTFGFVPPPDGAAFDGVSVTVNDVERYRQYFAVAGPTDSNFTWARPSDATYDEYLRFACVRDGKILDYSKPATWFSNGTVNVPAA